MAVQPEEPKNFSWVIDNVLAGSAFPEEPKHVQFLVDKNIKIVVNMMEEKDPPMEQFKGKITMVTDFKLPDFTTPTVEMVDKFVKMVDDCRGKKEAVIVHCMRGQGRTGTLLACYLIKEKKLSGEKAIEEIRRLRPGSLETPEQEETVTQYAKHLKC